MLLNKEEFTINTVALAVPASGPVSSEVCQIAMPMIRARLATTARATRMILRATAI